jgi:hypothetical protein
VLELVQRPAEGSLRHINDGMLASR